MKGDKAMLIIVKDTPLTENIKAETYKYSGWFKVMNRISNLIQELEQIDKNLTQYDIELIRVDTVEQINSILDMIEKTIKYAKEITWEEKPFWQTGNLNDLLRRETIRKKRK